MSGQGIHRTRSGLTLGAELELFLSAANPWWQGTRLRPAHPYRRWLFQHTLKNLKNGLAPVTVLRGPRQVGKTTLQEQIIAYLLNEEGINPKGFSASNSMTCQHSIP